MPKTEAKVGSVAAPIDLDALPLEPSPSGAPAAASLHAQHPGNLATAHRVVAPPVVAKGAAGPRKHAGDDELDVGY